MKRVTIVVYSSQKKKKDCTICTGWLFKRHKAAGNTDNIKKSFEVKNKGNEEQQNI